MTEADLAYISSNYLTLEQLCDGRAESPHELRSLIAARRLPEPSYVLPDGTGMFPADYFRLVDEAGGVDGLREHFAARHRAVDGKDGDPGWEMYLGGTWGIFLRDVTPEPEWQTALREQVDELDELEREFAPDYDRSDAMDRPPTRDLIIAAARERYPQVFAA